MAYQSVIGGMMIPVPPLNIGNAPSYGSVVIDAADEKIGFLVQVPKTGTISKIWWRTNTVTTGATLDVRLETIVAGVPSGTLFATTTNGAQVVADANDNTAFQTSLTSGASVTQGDKVAVVISNPTVSFGNMQIAVGGTSARSTTFPYVMSYAGSWANEINGGPLVAFEYNDGSYAPMPEVHMFATNVTTTFNSGSAADEVGVYFQFDFPVKVSGCWLWYNPDEASGGDFNIVLYDSDGSTALLTYVHDQTDSYDGALTRIGYFKFSSSATLLADTNYRLVVKPTSATNVGIYEFTVTSAAMMDAYPGGQAWHRTHRVDAGSWTQTTTQRPHLGLIVDSFSDGVSSGGTGGGSVGGMHRRMSKL